MAEKTILLGSKNFGLQCLKILDNMIGYQDLVAITIDDRTDTRSIFPEFTQYCEDKYISLSVVKKPSELKSLLLHYEPITVFVVGWYWILPSDVLGLVPRGFVGLHASLLPQLRGNAPLVWAILLGYSETGVTLFYLDEGMDTGDIIAQHAFPIAQSDTIADVLSKAEISGQELISKHAIAVIQGKAQRHLQKHERASYVSLRRPDDGLINWHHSSSQIWNFVRAQTRPYPGAFTYLPNGRRLRIWQVKPFPLPFHGIPGLVCQQLQDGTVVACGDGAVMVQECHIEHESPAPVAQVLRWGMRLG